MNELAAAILRLIIDLGWPTVAELIRRGASGTTHEARVAELLPEDPRALLSTEEREALDALGMVRS